MGVSFKETFIAGLTPVLGPDIFNPSDLLLSLVFGGGFLVCDVQILTSIPKCTTSVLGELGTCLVHFLEWSLCSLDELEFELD